MLNEHIAVVGSRRSASLGVSGAVQNTPECCPTEEHGS